MAMRGDEARAMEAGFDAYLTKPVVRRDLEETVARLLARGNGASFQRAAYRRSGRLPDVISSAVAVTGSAR